MDIYLATPNGDRLQTVTHEGRTWVLVPENGGEYEIVLDNSKNYDNKLCVVSVDGRNVIDGSPASESDDGFVVRGKSVWPIKGWRQSGEKVAAFTFVDSSKSYDVLTGGNGQALQSIGVAVFNEREKEVYRSRNWGGGSHPSTFGETTRGGSHSMGVKGAPTSIGTGYGESRTMVTQKTTFDRASRDPAFVVIIEYATRSQLRGWGFPVPPPKPNPFPGKPARNVSVPPPPGR